MKTKIG